ncbi:hypothetical protein TNCV_830731 [Trichonephila clavipes]|nr:hypothetical protein TNCV_830731 [Trichonephila clavipes]
MTPPAFDLRKHEEAVRNCLRDTTPSGRERKSRRGSARGSKKRTAPNLSAESAENEDSYLFADEFNVIL